MEAARALKLTFFGVTGSIVSAKLTQTIGDKEISELLYVQTIPAELIEDIADQLKIVPYF